jgi:predicted amidohydrolase
MVKIGLVQMSCDKADIDNNLRRHNDFIIEAEEKDVDILAFPEASITGYTDRGGYPGAIIRSYGSEIDTVYRMTTGRNVIVLAGFIESNRGGKPYVTQIVIRNGRLIGCYRNTLRDHS